MPVDIEKLLTGLFDAQRFAGCPALQRVIDDAETRYFGEECSAEALSELSAAGDPWATSFDPKIRGGPT